MFCSSRTSIIIAPIDIFDYSKGEPAEDVLTILRVLKVRSRFHMFFTARNPRQISNPWALRIFVNSHGIERTGLSRTRLEAETLLNKSGLGLAVAAEDMQTVRAWACVQLRRGRFCADALSQRWRSLHPESDARAEE